MFIFSESINCRPYNIVALSRPVCQKILWYLIFLSSFSIFDVIWGKISKY